MITGWLLGCQSIGNQANTNSPLQIGEKVTTASEVNVPQDAIKAPSNSKVEPNITLKNQVEKQKPTTVLSSEIKTEIKPKDPIVERLLKQAEVALKELRLITPEDDSANLYYQIVLGRDPYNVEARYGLASIVTYYTDWAWQKHSTGQPTAANKFLDYAMLVNPDDPLIQETRQKIQKFNQNQAHKKQTNIALENAPTLEKNPNRYYLPENLFSMTDEEILFELQPIIDRVAMEKRPIEIYWPNDKQARLMYQIINSRVANYRVRGMIYHQQKYMIELKQ